MDPSSDDDGEAGTPAAHAAHPLSERLNAAKDLIAENRAAVEGIVKRIAGQLSETRAQLSTDHERIGQTDDRVQTTVRKLRSDPEVQHVRGSDEVSGEPE